MIFWTLTTFLCISLLIQIIKIKSISKRDHYLFALCDLRREVMRYLRSSSDKLSKKEYISLKSILKSIDVAIECYSKNYARKIFNFRKFADFVKEAENLNHKSEEIDAQDNEMINNFRAKLQLYILKSFFAYTPFIFEEITASLAAMFWKRIPAIL